jgi:hypothetical protein
MELNELVRVAHQNAVAAGWWDKGTEKTALQCHMLIVSEIVEATEAVRNGLPDCYVEGGEPGHIVEVNPADLLFDPAGKPEGQAVELADAVIRIFDWAGRNNWDMDSIIKAKMEYNKTRGHRHGGKTV